MLRKALEWASFHRGPAFGENGRSFLWAFEIKRYVKMPCKRVSLSIGVPLGNLEGIRLTGLFERKGKYIWIHFLDPENIKILSVGARDRALLS